MRKGLNKLALVFVFLLYFLTGEASSNSLSGDRDYYCVQLVTSPYPSQLVEMATELSGRFEDVRVEKIGSLYTLRVGFWDRVREGKDVLRELKRRFPSAFMRVCAYKPERWIFPSKVVRKREQEVEEVENRVPEEKSESVAQELHSEEEKEGVLPSWLREGILELPKWFKQAVFSEDKPLDVAASESAKSASSESFTEGALFLKYYLNLYARVADSLESGTCKLEGKDLVLKPGVKFAWSMTDKLSLWGDVRVGGAYQKFLDTHRKKFWLDIRQLYISNRPIFDPNYYGFVFSAGRVLVSEPRGFWFYNSIDGIRVDYLSTLLSGSLWLGKRINDVYVTNNEERSNISGYTYLVGTVDYQYRYRQHIHLFYVKEYRGSSASVGDTFDVWSPVKEKENLNWVGGRWTYSWDDRFEGRKVDLWLDVGYMWGDRDILETQRVGCTATSEVISVASASMDGGGFELGGKYIDNDVGIGARVAGGTEYFYQPRLSSNREHLFGPNTIRYYGEYTNPDLTNTLIFSVFGGYQWKENHWIELNILKYNLVNKDQGTSFSRYFPSPNGKDGDLGWEIDFILEGEEKGLSAKWRYYLIGSYFEPGSAYDGVSEVDRSYGLFLNIKRYW
ncbi:alginate export family protein [Phorcysia thermohydrogeniphila]|uniref:Alginate production protein n=1 Tax=Phorcysia thermohydrogeniphila TaxID=936138 RepID=A0A4R1GHE2_9BACT|nr:alginate export family protein [Phorcysia thermohydrogeniphila]TCK05279.1 alginate production protein [Phorcysia thermohydrogeniphila]